MKFRRINSAGSTLLTTPPVAPPTGALISFNYSISGVFGTGDPVPCQARVWAYKLYGGLKVFSATYTESDVTSLASASYDIRVDWNTTPDADGYLIHLIWNVGGGEFAIDGYKFVDKDSNFFVFGSVGWFDGAWSDSIPALTVTTYSSLVYKDWAFGHGFDDYAVDEEAIELNVETRILSWVGDCFFALQDFVDWKSRLDVGQQSALRDEIKKVIMQSEGVVNVLDIQLTFDSARRFINIIYTIQTVFSQSFQSQVQQNLVGG